MRTPIRSASVAVFMFVCANLLANDLAAVRERMNKRIPEIAELKTRQIVGENRAGLLEIVKPAEADNDARTLVKAENADRQIAYAAIAAKAGTSVDQVGAQRATSIAQRAAPGVMLQREDGTWYAKR